MNHFISLAEAKAMTALYREHHEKVLATVYQGQAILALSETFDRSAIDTLLSKKGCRSLRIYYGMDQDYKVHAIIVAVDEAGRDIVPESGLMETSEAGDIVERATRCPDICPDESPLNS